MMHTYISEHPEFLFDEVELGEEDILGRVGTDLELTKDWFVGMSASTGSGKVRRRFSA